MTEAPGYGPLAWEVAYRKWRVAADKPGPRTESVAAIYNRQRRIAHLKARYETLLLEYKKASL